MLESLIEILACPYCQVGEMKLEKAQLCHDQIISGEILCAKCSRKYPIEDGIPCLLPDELLNLSMAKVRALLGKRRKLENQIRFEDRISYEQRFIESAREEGIDAYEDSFLWE